MFIHPNAFKMIKQERYQDKIPVFLANFFLQQQSAIHIMHLFCVCQKISIVDVISNQSYCAETDRGVQGDQVNRGD